MAAYLPSQLLSSTRTRLQCSFEGSQKQPFCRGNYHNDVNSCHSTYSDNFFLDFTPFYLAVFRLFFSALTEEL